MILDEEKKNENSGEENEILKGENIENTPENSGDEPVTAEEAESEESLEEELDKVLDTFTDELEKSKADYEPAAEAEAEDGEESEPGGEAEEEKKPCSVCGENPVDTSDNPASEYCEKCRKARIKYPLPVKGTLALILLIISALFAVMYFTVNLSPAKMYADGIKLEKSGAQGEALEAYEYVAGAFDAISVKPYNLYGRDTEMRYKIGDIENVGKYAGEFNFKLDKGNIGSSAFNFPSYLLSRLPKYKRVAVYNDKVESFLEGVNETYAVYSKYEVQTAADLNDEVLAEIESLTGEDTDAAYPEYRAAGIYYSCYNAANMLQKSEEEQLAYLEKIAKSAPDAYWLYGYPLYQNYMEASDYGEVSALTGKMLKNYKYDAMARYMLASVYRYQNEYDKAIKECEKLSGSGALRAERAVNLLLKDEAREAYTFLLENEESFSTYMEFDTFAVCCLITGEQEKYEEISQLFEYYGYTFSEGVYRLEDGEDAKTVLEDMYLNKGGKG